ncbi:hypothetical protein CAEBREN_03008 [Caenorhabditis brenneri]|uniref:Uncharacterized protein n=1 Tax=Caenorhabditis brenneri TaxID=135651 RepID=G0NS31_CAEBE|nr:hypothetical protein CAEBREN_03008 [Caenorhabditis brenneri]
MEKLDPLDYGTQTFDHKPQQPSKRIVKPNSKYGYIPFSIPTTRTTTTNSSIADPPPQKKIRMMQLEVKKEVIEPDEVDPLSFPAPKRERGRPKKEQAVDLHEEDSEDDQADDEPQTEPKKGFSDSYSCFIPGKQKKNQKFVPKNAKIKSARAMTNGS